MTREEVLLEEFTLLRQEIIDAYDRKNMRASGNFERELEVRIEKNLGVLVGAPYAQQLETERKAGGFPPIKAIEQWIYDKGLDSQIEGNIKVRSLAFLIARKIAKHGWDRGGDVNLISEIVTPQRMQRIIDRIGEHAIIEITTDIVFMFENELK